MSFHALSTVLGWVAVSLGVGSTVAQHRRAKFIGIEGVSLATWVMFILLGLFWISYGIAVHSLIIVLGSLLVLPLQLAIVFRLQPWKRWHVAVRCLIFFVLCCVMPTLFWGWAAGVLGAGVAMVGNRAPQIIELVKYRGASGVSVGGWTLSVCCAALWAGYYIGFHMWAALTATCFAGAANLAIALLATWRHRQRRDDLIRDVVFAT
jgi:uncharacterized protein with PQ loop repeat